MPIVHDYNYKEYFGQTSRAILFEQFAEYDAQGNPREGLADYLKTMDTNPDQFSKDIEKLVVYSFKEFVEKFAPPIYPVMKASREGTLENGEEMAVDYTIERPSNWNDDQLPETLESNMFYKALERMYQARKESGNTLIEFNQNEFERMLSPESQLKEYQKIRRDMNIAERKYQELESKDASVEEINAQMDIINDCLLELKDKYSKGMVGFIPISLADRDEQYRLAMKNKDGSEGGKEDKNKTQTSFLAEISYDNEGKMIAKKIEMKDSDSEEGNGDGDFHKALIKQLKKDFENNAPGGLGKLEYLNKLVVRTMTSGVVEYNENKIEELKEARKIEQVAYKKMMEKMMEAVAPLVEKFLGVRAFFDNATVDGELEAGIIIANSTVKSLLEDGNDKRLEDFLDKQRERHKNKIWFGILPAVGLGDEKKLTNSIPKRRKLGEYREEKKEKVNGLTTISEATTLLNICKKTQVMTFFNYKANENTSFSKINAEKFHQMRDQGVKLEDGRYAVCALPNFTISVKSEYKLNEEFVEKYGEDAVKVSFPGIYIEAAYVAAGMVVGSQQPKVLIEKGIDIEPKNTCVRINFEDSKIGEKYLTSMCIESAMPSQRKFLDEMMESRFGFFFSDNEFYDRITGKYIPRCSVQSARTMELKDGKYKSLYRTLFIEFVEICVKGDNSRADSEKIKEFLIDDVKEWSRNSQTAMGEKANALLYQDENIELDETGSKTSYSITLKGDNEKLPFDVKERN